MPGIRSAVRFPLHIPLYVYKDTKEWCAETMDISAGGVRFSRHVLRHGNLGRQFRLLRRNFPRAHQLVEKLRRWR